MTQLNPFYSPVLTRKYKLNKTVTNIICVSPVINRLVDKDTHHLGSVYIPPSTSNSVTFRHEGFRMDRIAHNWLQSVR